MERLTNLALGWLMVAAFVTGWMSFASGTPAGDWVPVLHELLGLALLAPVPAKLPIARRGLRRQRRGRRASLVLAGLAVVTVASGAGLTTGGLDRVGPLTGMQLHVGSAVLSLALVLWHIRTRPLPRPAGPAAPGVDEDRRAFLRIGVIGAVAAVTWRGWEAVGAAARRFTGSHQRGSWRPEAMPVVQWLDDRVPHLGPDHRVTVNDAPLSVNDLAGISVEEVDAVIDCTGGWYARQVWTGVRLDRLVDAGDARSVVVTSVTGYARRFPVRDLSRLWLAVAVGGAALSSGHGHPVRLVAPGRRGFWWVKWIGSIRTSRLPWWVQSPFPLT